MRKSNLDKELDDLGRTIIIVWCIIIGVIFMMYMGWSPWSSPTRYMEDVYAND